jgi:tetratricopeptide (TPR) repeat protein
MYSPKENTLANGYNYGIKKEKREIAMKLLPRINMAGLVVRALMFVALSVSPLLADYSNPKVPADAQDPVYWLDQGGLFATYGNYSKAVQAFKKALALDDNSSEGHYDIALAYNELGQPESALAEINRAIALDPGQSRYYYGRAWILLKFGHSKEAMDDFQKAADMGNPDAISYLKGLAQK